MASERSYYYERGSAARDYYAQPVRKELPDTGIQRRYGKKAAPRTEVRMRPRADRALAFNFGYTFFVLVSVAIMIAACLLVYAIAQMVFWLSTGAGLAAGNVVFKYVLLPITAILLSTFAGRNDWWGKGKWSLVAIFAILFLLVPQVTYEATATEAAKNFMFPNFRYMIIGIASSLVGLVAGMKFKKK